MNRQRALRTASGLVSLALLVGCHGGTAEIGPVTLPQPTAPGSDAPGQLVVLGTENLDFDTHTSTFGCRLSVYIVRFAKSAQQSIAAAVAQRFPNVRPSGATPGTGARVVTVRVQDVRRDINCLDPSPTLNSLPPCISAASLRLSAEVTRDGSTISSIEKLGYYSMMGSHSVCTKLTLDLQTVVAGAFTDALTKLVNEMRIE